MTTNEKSWREFFIEDIFEILPGKRLTKAEMIPGDVPFIGASDSNNGVTSFVGNDNESTDENFLSVSYNGSVCQCFYHPYRCLCSDDVKRFHLKNRAGNRYVYLFLASCIRQQKDKYNYGYKFNETRMRRQKIMLPAKDDGAPDFDFMENFIRAIEESQLQKYRDYLAELDTSGGGAISKLSEKVWHEFNLSEVFSIRATSSGIDKNKLDLMDGEFPYVTRTDRNNGIQCFICEQPNYKRDVGNCITVGLDTQTAFYQPTDFYTGQNIQILTNEKLNAYNAKFLLPCLKKTLSIFSWGGNGATLTRLRRSKIMLPVDESGAPDYEYMGNYVRAIEESQLQKYRDFVQEVDAAQIPPLKEKTWRPFLIGDLFRLEMGKSKGLTHLEEDASGISYLGATNRNNGVLTFVKPVEDLIQRGNCIAFIRNGEGSVGYSVYKREDFIATSDITCGYADFLNEYVGMFITTVADKVRGKYNFNYKRSETRLKREKIMLPVDESGAPDFEYMEAFIKNLMAAQYRKYLDLDYQGIATELKYVHKTLCSVYDSLDAIPVKCKAVE